LLFEEKKKTPLLSQEGWREAPGWFPARKFLKMHSEKPSLWNHLQSHRKKCDDSALPTKEGSLSYFRCLNFFLSQVMNK
jgi:hypothetical protein